MASCGVLVTGAQGQGATHWRSQNDCCSWRMRLSIWTDGRENLTSTRAGCNRASKTSQMTSETISILLRALMSLHSSQQRLRLCGAQCEEWKCCFQSVVVLRNMFTTVFVTHINYDLTDCTYVHLHNIWFARTKTNDNQLIAQR